MNKTFWILALAISGCSNTDTLEERMGSDDSGVFVLESTLQNGVAQEMELALGDGPEVGMGISGNVVLRMTESLELNPHVVGAGRASLLRVPGTFDTLDDALPAVDGAEWLGEDGFELTSLGPGTALVVDTLRQDYLLHVVDRDVFVRGRCTDVAQIAFRLAPIDDVM